MRLRLIIALSVVLIFGPSCKAGFAIFQTNGTSVFLLDTFSGAKAAYALRKLRSAYAGSAIQLQRASDNATQDIGFQSNGNLDTAAAATFLTSTTGGIKIWYDQSGFGNDLVQNTQANQLQYVASGATINPSTTSSYPVLRTKTAPSVSSMHAADSASYKTGIVDAYAVGKLGIQGGPGYNGGLAVGYPRTTTSTTNGDFVWQLSISGENLITQAYIGGSGFNNNTSGFSGFARAFWDNIYQYNFDTSDESLRYNNHLLPGGNGTTLAYPNAVGLYIGSDPTLSTTGALSSADFVEIIIYGASQSSTVKAGIAANQGAYYMVVDPPTSIATYYNGTAPDGFSWTPVYNFPGFVAQQSFAPVDTATYFNEGAGNFWSLWKANNVNNGAVMWRFELHANDVPDYISSTGERSELDGGAGGEIPGDTTIQVSYALWVEPPGFLPTKPPQSWNTLGQFHYGANIGFPPTSFAFNMFNNQLRAEVDNSGSPNPYTLSLTPGQWYDIFFVIKQSLSGTADILQVYVNGTQQINMSGSVFNNENASGNLAKGYWKVGIYRGDIPTTTVEAARYANLEVVNQAVANITARIATPLAHPTHP